MTPEKWADFIERHEDAEVYGGYSTGQQLLLALALCKPEWLPPGYERDINNRGRWWRLDSEQIEGILVWCDRKRG